MKFHIEQDRWNAHRARPSTCEELSSTPGGLQDAFAELLKAWQYAQAAVRDVWDFAVEIDVLRDMRGVTASDLRWLAAMGYVEHAREVTRSGDDRRQFACNRPLSFSQRTCFVLTESGIEYASNLLSEQSNLLSNKPDQWIDQPVVTASGPELCGVPTWNTERRELRAQGMLVKLFRWPAVNQEAILSAFQEEGWPARIDDPLPQQRNLDPVRRLHDTIKCLNRNQKHRLVRFRGDGSGEGVLWGFTEQADLLLRTASAGRH